MAAATALESERVLRLVQEIYLQRLPAKSLEDIYTETKPPVSLPQPIDFRARVAQLPGEFGTRPTVELIKELNDLLVAARQDPEYGRKEWSGPGLINLLHDLLDLVSTGNGNRRDWTRYAEWRLQHLDWFGFSEDPNLAKGDAKTVSDRAAELGSQLANASPQLRPHWMYLLGALGFKSGEDTKSQQWFERVVNQYPLHPRAEAALFMDGRCQLSRALKEPFRQQRASRPSLLCSTRWLFFWPVSVEG